MNLRHIWWDWNPVRLRRLLKQAKTATDANAYGWANTHMELVALQNKLITRADTESGRDDKR